ncbi:MAG: redoxin family protein [Alistipes sp.]|jgi:peroxiredoxin|nr:redoxin family protein [Alistipes sp.]
MNSTTKTIAAALTTTLMLTLTGCIFGEKSADSLAVGSPMPKFSVSRPADTAGPSTPSTPESPETPAAPETPGTSTPENPETETPETPATPETPETPGTETPEMITITDADLAGAPAVVVFFRTTCPDCSREMPGVEEAFRRVGGSESGIRFVAISREDNAATAVPEYWQATGMTMQWFLDPEGSATAAFEVKYVPTLYLFGSDGRLVHAAVETFDFTVDELVELLEGLE